MILEWAIGVIAVILVALLIWAIDDIHRERKEFGDAE